MRKRKFTDEQEQEIYRRYQEGESTHQLGTAFGVGHVTIGNILKRSGVKIRSVKEAKGGLTDEVEAEVCRRYQEGESTHQLGAAFGVGQSTIRNTLKRNGAKPRTTKEASGGLTDEAEAEVCRRYQEGENTMQLGTAFEVDRVTIGRILKRNGAKVRSVKEASGGLVDEAEAEVCRRYQKGEDTYRLGTAFGVSNVTIGKILKRNGIELRTSGGGGDSIQHVLDCTGRHTHPRECEFYIVELARYSSTHCKPGIAFNSDQRAAIAGGEYGAEVLRLVFATRAEAYALEQALLDQTRGCADCPDDLIAEGWIGASEVRAMPAEDMVPVALRLAEELEEMGVWSFMAAYLPMTAAQRMQCQQRAQQQAQQTAAAGGEA